MGHSSSWKETNNLLCIRLDSMGDVLMTTPAIRALKEGNPNRKITLLTSPQGAQVAPLLGMVDETIVYEAPWIKASTPTASSQPDLEMIDRLRDLHFDAAVIFTVFSQSSLPTAMMAYMADIPLRLAHSRENPYHLLTDWVRETDNFGQLNIRHEVRRQLDLVAHIGEKTSDERLSLDVSPEAVGEVLITLKEMGLDSSKPWLVMHPGASAASRRYPAESFARAARRLVSAHDFQVVLTGSTVEYELVEEIRQLMGGKSFSLAGALDIQAMSALLFLAPLLISNNSGPVHMAAAVQTPVVDLYALTNPQHTPWKVPHRTLYHDVPCKFCYKSVCPLGHHHCLQLVPPEAVVGAALDLLEESQSIMEHGDLDFLRDSLGMQNERRS
jgi:lipopolysaccharide heptosyltransferase II